MIISFVFDKISVNKKKAVKGNIRVNNVVNITKVEETNVPIKDKKALKVSFDFIVKYEPDAADMLLKGFLVYIMDDTKEILKTWKENKQIKDMEFNANVVNVIFMKCNMKALQLSENLNLPLPVQLPRITAGKEKQETRKSQPPTR